MTDAVTFNPFPIDPPAPPTKGKSKRGRPRQARQPAASREPVSAKKTRKPRQVRALKLDIATMMPALAGLTADDGKLLAGIVEALQNVSKPSRVRIVEALGKLFK